MNTMKLNLILKKCNTYFVFTEEPPGEVEEVDEFDPNNPLDGNPEININVPGDPSGGLGSPGSSPLKRSLKMRMSKEFNQKIRVCVRKRPLSKKEISKSEKDIVIVGGRQECVVHEPKYVLSFYALVCIF